MSAIEVPPAARATLDDVAGYLSSIAAMFSRQGKYVSAEMAKTKARALRTLGRAPSLGRARRGR